MTNQYMTKLYHDLLSNSPQTVTIDIPADMGTGQISQIVTKQGAVVSDWRMNYFSDMNVQGVSSEDTAAYIRYRSMVSVFHIVGSQKKHQQIQGLVALYNRR